MADYRGQDLFAPFDVCVPDHTFYLDETNLLGTSREIEKWLLQNGGKLEKFLTKGVTCMITTAIQAKPLCPLPNLLSRGSHMVKRAEVKKSSGVIESATNLGCKIIKLDPRELKKFSASRKRALAVADNYAQQKINSKELGPCFLKVEDVNSRYRPFYGTWRSRLKHSMKKNPKLVDPDNEEALVQFKRTACPFYGHKEYEEEYQRHLERQKQAKPVFHKRKHSKGYCEICDVTYPNRQLHLQSDQHQTFSKDPGNYASLDAIVSSLPTIQDLIEEFAPTAHKDILLTFHGKDHVESKDLGSQEVLSPIPCTIKDCNILFQIDQYIHAFGDIDGACVADIMQQDSCGNDAIDIDTVPSHSLPIGCKSPCQNDVNTSSTLLSVPSAKSIESHSEKQCISSTCRRLNVPFDVSGRLEEVLQPNTEMSNITQDPVLTRTATPSGSNAIAQSSLLSQVYNPNLSPPFQKSPPQSVESCHLVPSLLPSPHHPSACLSDLELRDHCNNIQVKGKSLIPDSPQQNGAATPVIIANPPLIESRLTRTLKLTDDNVNIGEDFYQALEGLNIENNKCSPDEDKVNITDTCLLWKTNSIPSPGGIQDSDYKSKVNEKSPECISSKMSPSQFSNFENDAIIELGKKPECTFSGFLRTPPSLVPYPEFAAVEYNQPQACHSTRIIEPVALERNPCVNICRQLLSVPAARNYLAAIGEQDLCPKKLGNVSSGENVSASSNDLDELSFLPELACLNATLISQQDGNQDKACSEYTISVEEQIKGIIDSVSTGTKTNCFSSVLKGREQMLCPKEASVGLAHIHDEEQVQIGGQESMQIVKKGCNSSLGNMVDLVQDWLNKSSDNLPLSLEQCSGSEGEVFDAVELEKETDLEDMGKAHNSIVSDWLNKSPHDLPLPPEQCNSSEGEPLDAVELEKETDLDDMGKADFSDIEGLDVSAGPEFSDLPSSAGDRIQISQLLEDLHDPSSEILPSYNKEGFIFEEQNRDDRSHDETNLSTVDMISNGGVRTEKNSLEMEHLSRANAFPAVSWPVDRTILRSPPLNAETSTHLMMSDHMTEGSSYGTNSELSAGWAECSESSLDSTTSYSDEQSSSHIKDRLGIQSGVGFSAELRASPTKRSIKMLLRRGMINSKGRQQSLNNVESTTSDGSLPSVVKSPPSTSSSLSEDDMCTDPSSETLLKSRPHSPLPPLCIGSPKTPKRVEDSSCWVATPISASKLRLSRVCGTPDNSRASYSSPSMRYAVQRSGDCKMLFYSVDRPKRKREFTSGGRAKRIKLDFDDPQR